MKTKLFLSALLVLSYLSGSGQHYSSAVEKKNIVKTNLTGYVFRNYNISYERAIIKWFSVNISYGNISEGKVPFSSLLLSDDESNDFKNIQMSGNQFTLEPRFYLGNRGFGKGFYLAPYYRYSQFDLSNAVYNYYTDDTQKEIPLKLSGNITGNSFGLMIGYQWFLGKKDNWVLDFWILGGHYGKGKGVIDGVSDQILTPKQQQELKSDLEGQDIPLVKYTVTTNSNGAQINIDGPWAGLRSGLSFGYRF